MEKTIEQNYLGPKEVVDTYIQIGVTKANLPIGKMVLLGLLSGMFIGIGGAGSTVLAHDIAHVGFQRLMAGLVFPVGLMMIMLMGGELFTSNCLITMAVWDKKVHALQMFKNLAIVLISNFVGILFIDILIIFSGQLEFTNGKLGAYMISLAVRKIEISPLRAVVSGVLCNILVCTAVLMVTASKDITGKLLAVWFPICLFVVSGYEHIIANMYYLPVGMMAALEPEYATLAKEIYGLTDAQIHGLTVGNALLPTFLVTVGNFLGGCIMGRIYYMTQRMHWKAKLADK